MGHKIRMNGGEKTKNLLVSSTHYSYFTFLRSRVALDRRLVHAEFAILLWFFYYFGQIVKDTLWHRDLCVSRNHENNILHPR